MKDKEKKQNSSKLLKKFTIDRETRKFEINCKNEAELKFFRDNTIKTAKYNILTFLPVALIYQFNSYFNLYFLLVTIIYSIKEISNMDPGVGLGPFIFVIGISMFREAVEDIVRL